jgi:hypothetical protein
MVGTSAYPADAEPGVGIGNLTKDVDKSFDHHRERVYTDLGAMERRPPTAWLR